VSGSGLETSGDRVSDRVRVANLQVDGVITSGNRSRGLALALQAEGKVGEAEQVKRQFSQAWAQAGVTLTRSRF